MGTKSMIAKQERSVQFSFQCVFSTSISIRGTEQACQTWVLIRNGIVVFMTISKSANDRSIQVLSMLTLFANTIPWQSSVLRFMTSQPWTGWLLHHCKQMAACWRIRTVLRDPEMRRWSSSVWLRSYSRLMSTYVIIQKWPKGRNRWQTERLHVILVETSLHGLHLRLVCEQIVTVTNLSRHIQQLRYISKVGP